MKNLSYKQFLAESDKFKKAVVGYIESRDYEVEHKELSYQIIDEISKQSEKDADLRAEAYKYFTCREGYYTSKLREICYKAGFDYSASINSNELALANAIDTIDTAHLYYREEQPQ